MVLVGTFISCDDDIAQSEVPSVIDNTFKTRFPDAKDVEWEKIKEYYEVDFEWQNIDHSALLDDTGDILKFKYDLQVSQLPQSIKTNFKQQFPKKIMDDAEAVNVKEIIYYQIEADGFLNDKKLVFDTNGEEITDYEYWN